jgi:hypothetical protein
MSYEEEDTCLRVNVGRKRGSVGNSSVTNHERPKNSCDSLCVVSILLSSRIRPRML